MFERVQNFAAVKIDSYARNRAKKAAGQFFHGPAARNIVGHLRSEEFKPQEPDDTKSSEWLLWYLIENRKQVVAQLIEALEGEKEISGAVVKQKLAPLLAQMIEAEARPQIVEAINAVSDPIAQAVLRMFIEINHTMAEVAAGESRSDTPSADGMRLSSLARRIKGAAGKRLHHIVPAESKSDVIKKAGRLLVRSLGECGVAL